MKVKLKSNAEKADNSGERTRDLVRQLLKKLQERDLIPDEVSPYADRLDACKEPKRPKKEGEWRAESTAAFIDLIDKLSKARSEDGLKQCIEMKLQLLNQSESKALSPSGEQEPDKPLEPKQEPDSVYLSILYPRHAPLFIWIRKPFSTLTPSFVSGCSFTNPRHIINIAND